MRMDDNVHGRKGWRRSAKEFYDNYFKKIDEELDKPEIVNSEPDEKCPLCGSSVFAQPLEVGISGEGVGPTHSIESKQYPMSYEQVCKVCGLVIRNSLFNE